MPNISRIRISCALCSRLRTRRWWNRKWILYGTMITDNPVLAKACAFQHRGALLLNKSHIPYSLEKEIYSATKSLVEGIELQLKDVLKFKSHEAIYQPNAASSNSQVFTSSLAQSLESDRTNGIIFLHQTCVEAFELIDEKIVFYPSRRITEPWI